MEDKISVPLRRVLIIAGSDPSGGAGIQADIKTVTALGGYAAAAITALTVQNTTGVFEVRQIDPDLIASQIDAVLSDIGADAVKIGMIGSAEAGAAIADSLQPLKGVAPIILDPVLAATSGHALAASGVAEVMREKLAPLAAIVTPNLDEAAALTGIACKDRNAIAKAGQAILQWGAGAALIKGGHGTEDPVEDWLFTRNGAERYAHPRIPGGPMHGTGCTLASAIATGCAQSLDQKEAIGRAIDYVQRAIAAAPAFGAGARPLHHTPHN